MVVELEERYRKDTAVKELDQAMQKLMNEGEENK